MRQRDIEAMEPEARAAAIDLLVQETRKAPNGELTKLEARIRGFEASYGVTSEKLRAEVAAGTRQETWDVCEWLMALRLRDQLATGTPRPR